VLCGKSSYLRTFACTRRAHARRGRFAVSTVPDSGLAPDLPIAAARWIFFVFFVLILEETAFSC